MTAWSGTFHGQPVTRAPFDSTCDIFSGPGTAFPGILRGTFPCRLVPVDGIFSVGIGTADFVAWLTLAGYIPIGAWKSPAYGSDPRLADQVAVPSGSGVQYWVVLTQEVLWRAQPLYYRAELAFLPLPSTLPPSALALVGVPPPPARIVFSRPLAFVGAVALTAWPLPAGAVALTAWPLPAGAVALTAWPIPRQGIVLSEPLAFTGALALTAWPISRQGIVFDTARLTQEGIGVSAWPLPAARSLLVLSAAVPPRQGLAVTAWPIPAARIGFATWPVPAARIGFATWPIPAARIGFATWPIPAARIGFS